MFDFRVYVQGLGVRIAETVLASQTLAFSILVGWFQEFDLMCQITKSLQDADLPTRTVLASCTVCLLFFVCSLESSLSERIWLSFFSVVNGPDGLVDETTDVKNVGSMYRCAFRHWNLDLNLRVCKRLV